jgi:hypothetical protein
VHVKPTAVMADLRSEAKKAFKGEYVKRFVDPGNETCIRALYTHLSKVKVTNRSASAWEEDQEAVMKKSRAAYAATDPVSPVEEFLYCATDGKPFQGDGVMVCKKTGSEEDPSFSVRITKLALFAMYEKGGVDHPLTQTAFTQEVGRVLHGSSGYKPNIYDDDDDDYHPVMSAPQVHCKVRGERVWQFDTDAVHAWLGRKKLLQTAEPNDVEGAQKEITSAEEPMFVNIN